MIRLVVALLLLASSVLVARPALADDVAQAKAHFAIGTRAYDEKKFKVAIDAFQEAHRLAPRPGILFSIAQAYRRQYYIDRKLSDLSSAVTFYKKYVAADPNGSRIGEAGTILADLEPMADRLGAAAAPPPPAEKAGARILIAPSVKGAKAAVDGGAPIELPARVEVQPGKHTVVVTADGYLDERREIDLGPGEPFALDVKMTEKPARVTVAREGVAIYVDGRQVGETPLVRPLDLGAGRHVVSLTATGVVPITTELELTPGETRALKSDFEVSPFRKASIALIAIGVGGVVAGGVFTGLAINEEDKAKDVVAKAKDENISDGERIELNEAVSQRDTYRNTAVALYVGGGAVTLTGVLLFLLDRPAPGPVSVREAPTKTKPAEEPKEPVFDAHLSPVVGPGFFSLSVDGRF